MSKVMISQPRYLPCIGYLDRIQQADVFVILDTVQRNGRVYENRNKIKDKNGVDRWLTIPVQSSNREIIKNTIIKDNWRKDHVNKMYSYTGNDLWMAYYQMYLRQMTSLNYRDCLVGGLLFLKNLFDIETEFVLASSLSDVTNGGIQELINLTKLVGGDTYLSGPSCIEYGLTPEMANENGITLEIDISENYNVWLDKVTM